jgi:hypothetical protein
MLSRLGDSNLLKLQVGCACRLWGWAVLLGVLTLQNLSLAVLQALHICLAKLVTWCLGCATLGRNCARVLDWSGLCECSVWQGFLLASHQETVEGFA